MVDVVNGTTRNKTAARLLTEQLAKADWEGTLYIGYPVLSLADDTIAVDALLVTREHGLVVFVLAGESHVPRSDDAWTSIKDEQDRIFYAVQQNLSRHQSLRRGRELGVPINIVTVFPEQVDPPESIQVDVASPDSVIDVVERLPQPLGRLYKPLNAALQHVTTIKPLKKRTIAVTKGSRGAVLKQIEAEIANLDQWQKRAAIESPEGPQRVRGLAGSGKTVVLALKAAYLHAQHPEWNIVLTFHSRSLYQQFTDLVRRFSFDQLGDEPDWNKLRILHSWGGVSRSGVYAEIASHLRANARDYLYAKAVHGVDNAFAGICSELLSIAKAGDAEPLYDAVLIDEAQDLPPSFLQLIYHLTSPPKRIVWAYDELQNLSETAMPSLADMFGRGDNGEPLVSLGNAYGQAVQDIILPVCYRNTPWALTTAHAVGFGIYRKGGLVQHFDEPSLWEEIGYQIVTGSLATGQRVTLERRPGSYPDYFQTLLTPEDAIRTKVFTGEIDQAEWVAKRIKRNLDEDELEHDDILVILPNAATAKKRVVPIRDALARHGIESHLAGVTSSADEMFNSRSIAISNIYRAKGNEAPMVYVLNCQHCMGEHEQIKLRNTLFTAMTRSRAWLRLCGFGPEMNTLAEEVEQVKAKGYRLQFKIPTERELTKMRQIHRDRTPAEKDKIRRAERTLEQLVDAFRKGEIDAEMLPQDLRNSLRELLKNTGDDEDDA